MKLWMTGVVAFACIVAYGAVVAPNAAELDAAREKARALLADDFKALNNAWKKESEKVSGVDLGE